jgi:hypothetical protein
MGDVGWVRSDKLKTSSPRRAQVTAITRLRGPGTET